MRTISIGQKLLDWNRKHLLAEGELTTEMIAECFDSELTVVANGRRYETDLAGYLAFLNGFRQTIRQIDYEVLHEISEGHKTVLGMRTFVDRISGKQDRFEAMLLLEFNDAQKIKLWHEVYIEL